MLNYLVALSVVVSAICISSGPVSAIDISSSACRSSYKKYQRDLGYKAFALSKDKRSCGHSFRYPSRRTAAKRALSECRKHKTDCTIAHEALKKGVGTNLCRKSLGKFRGRPGHKAFAAATSGGCGAAWNRRSRHVAIKDALSFCKKSNPRSKCFVIRQK